MGILQSILSTETNEEENVISSCNNYEKTEYARLHSAHQWQTGNDCALSRNTKDLTLSVPNLRDSSSHDHTIVNNLQRSSAVSLKENTPQDGRRERNGMGPTPAEETNEEENVISLYDYYGKTEYARLHSLRQWQTGNDCSLFRNTKDLTLPVTNLRDLSSLDHKIVNNVPRRSAVSLKENTPKDGRRERNGMGPTPAEETNEVGNVISLYDYYGKTEYARLHSLRQWQTGNDCSLFRNTKDLTLPVTNLRDLSSLDHKIVNNVPRRSAVSLKENTPKDGRRERNGMGPTPAEETNEVGNVISLYDYYGKTEYARLHSLRQWQTGNDCSLFRNTKDLTLPVTNLRDLSSLDHKIVNNVPRRSAVFLKENTPQDGRRERNGMGPTPADKTPREGPVMIKCTVAAPEGRWIKHYSSCHRILLVGEGDFSFSTCLATAFGWASNIIATSLDSEAFLVKNYRNALYNIVELSIRKCKVMHEIDATKMAKHLILGQIKFDRIIFNFPFAGFFKDTSRDTQLQRHRTLVSQFLMNAKQMISEDGEIHITHKTNGFHMEWKIESVASSHKLRLLEAVDFNHMDYPGYNTKYGFGGDNNFNCYPSKTYKFGVQC